MPSYSLLKSLHASLSKQLYFHEIGVSEAWYCANKKPAKWPSLPLLENLCDL